MPPYLPNRLWGLLGPQRSIFVHIFVIGSLHLPLFFLILPNIITHLRTLKFYFNQSCDVQDIGSHISCGLPYGGPHNLLSVGFFTTH